MEKKQPSNYFLRLLQGLSNKSSNIRYTSKFALRKICSNNPSIFFTEFNYYIKDVKTLEPKPLTEFANALTAVSPSDDTYLSQLHSIMVNIENICNSQDVISSTSEIIDVATNFFNLKPALLPILSNPSKNLQVLTTLAVSQMITLGNENQAKKFYSVLLSSNCETNYHKFARARLIAAMCMHPELIPQDLKDSIQKSSELIIDLFCENCQTVFAPFIPTIISSYPPPKDKHSAIFKKFVEYISKFPNIAVYIIPAAVSISDISEAESLSLSEALIPILSIVPFHFTSTLPDDAAVNGFNVAVRAISTFITPETSQRITKFLINSAINGELEQRLGFHYALTCLVKLNAELDYQEIKQCFHRVFTPLEAGTLAELALALLAGGHHIMSWTDMVMLFEDCFSASNTISEQFVIDASALLGKHIDAPVSDVLTFFSHCVYERFKFAQVHFSILNTFFNKNSVKLSDFPPLLTMHMLLFIQYYPDLSQKQLKDICPLVGDVSSFLTSIDPNQHSIALRSMLKRFGNNEQCRNIIFDFINQLTWRCSKQEASNNVIKVMNIIGNNAEKMSEVISSLYAAFAYVDVHLATQSLQTYTTNQSRGWFLFSSSTKTNSSIRLVFLTLSKLKRHVTPFIQFATEHLPDPSNVEQCTEIISILAKVLKNSQEIQSEFPPKCCLFDFVMSLKYMSNDDIYRCIGELITISPIWQIEHIPFATGIILNAKEITNDLLFMLKRTLMIAETPSDIQLLIEPFVQKTTDSIYFQLLLSILEALTGDEHTNPDFPTLNYNCSSKLDNINGGFDRFLSLIAKIVGYYIPIFEKSHIAIEYILRIMGRLTKKIEVRTHLPLQEAVHCVAVSFNSQCILDAATLFCENFTIASITAFLILFKERENELLECAQTFIIKIFQERPDSAALVFDSSETLAKAATALLEINHLSLLQNVLKKSTFNKQIIETLLEYVLTKHEMIVKLCEETDITKDLIDIKRPEVQYAFVMHNENYEIDVDTWDTSKSMKFIELIKSSLEKVTDDIKIRFAKQTARIRDEEVVPLCVAIFEPYFKGENLSEVMPYLDPFARSTSMIPFITKSLPDGKIYRAALTICLSKPTTLPLIFNQIPKVLEWILKHQKIVKVLRKQKDVAMLKPYLPVIVANSLTQDQLLQKEIVYLIHEITGINCPPPTSFVGLFEICESVKFCDPDPECVVSLMKRSRQGDFAALIVICFIAHKSLLEKENYNEAQTIANSLLEKDSEEAQTAAFLCLSCFPIQNL